VGEGLDAGPRLVRLDLSRPINNMQSWIVFGNDWRHGGAVSGRGAKRAGVGMIGGMVAQCQRGAFGRWSSLKHEHGQI
jgi:hypothetical protein